MATPAPVYRSQGNTPFRSEKQNSQLKRGQTVPYDVNGAPAGGVPDTRMINTTAPLTGGGSLGTDLTLAISAATPAAAGSMSAADKTKLDAISGTNTGDQTITLTGPVTGSGTGSFGTTITNKAVTLAKMDDVATATVFYRKTAGTGVPEVQTLATLKTDLGLTGTNSGDQFTNVTSSRVLGRYTAGFGAAEEIALSGLSVAGGTLRVTFSATSRILARKTAGSGDAEEVTLSEVLDFIGSAAQGDILYRGASAWARLPAGTTGQFLKTLGAGADPAWAAASIASLRGCLGYLSVDGPSTNYTSDVIIGFPSEDYDTDSIHGLAATVTITIATPGVVTWTGHNFLAGTPMVLTTSGALPTGLTAGTVYYVVGVAANTFQLSATPGGAAIATSGTQSGTHTATNYSRFTVPAGVTKVRFKAQTSHGGTGASGNANIISLKKNGSTAYPGSPKTFIETTTLSGASGFASPILTVTAGDYFEVAFTSETDTSIVMLANFTWCEMEIIA